MNQEWIDREQIKPSNARQMILDYHSQGHPYPSQLQWLERIITR